jgi:hypothetical protein
MSPLSPSADVSDVVSPHNVDSVIHDTDLCSEQRCYLYGNAKISSLNTASYADQPTTTATIRVECTTFRGEERGATVTVRRRGTMMQPTVANTPVSLPSANFSLPEPLFPAEFHVHNR